jgi:MEMO1 family protein
MAKNNNTNQLSSNSRTMSSSSSSSAADPTAQSSSLYRRRAHHAGSWYQKDASTLDATLQEFLDNVVTTATTSDHEDSSKDDETSLLLRAVICPHAGFSYSGPTAAYSYHALQQALVSNSNNNETNNSKIKTILVLHPSHHVYINGCAVSGAKVLETPLRDLPVNDTLRREILALNNNDNNAADCVFSVMTQSQDEEEHSGEMQYPFLAKVIQNVAAPAAAAASARNQNMKKSTTTSTTTANGHSNHVNDTDTAADEVITVLPIMCGSLSVQQEAGFGRILSKIIHRPEILTVVSTDFCHWGSRFSYRPPCTTTTTTSSSSTCHNKQEDVVLPIHQLIEQLDRRGMSLIEAQEPGAFAAYLKETMNTICGRHAVAVWLRALEAGTALTMNGGKNDKDDKKMLHTVRFIRYAQSSPVTAMHESSVSYAAGIATTAATNDQVD